MLDVIGVMIALVVLVVSLYIGHAFWDEVSASGVLTESSNASQPIIEEVDFYFGNVTDNLVLAVFVGLLIGGIISAVLSRAHPAFYFIAIIVIIFLIIVGAIISIWYSSFSESSEFAGFINEYPKTHFIMNHLPSEVLLASFAIIICLYAVNRRGGGGSEF